MMCSTYYCSKKCQKIDWKVKHKLYCPTWRMYKLHRTSLFQEQSHIPRLLSSRPSIIVLIAGHISKTHYDGAPFSTILNQTSKPASIVVSISKDGDIEWPHYLKEFETIGTSVKLRRRSKKKSLLSHYDYLCSLLSDEADDSWILFSEYGGISHEHRIEEYEDRIYTEVLNNIVTTDIVAVKSIICGVKGDSSDTIRAAKVITNHPQSIFAREYVNYCIKLKYVRRFMRYCPQNVKNHPFCGILFSHYIKRLICSDKSHVIFVNVNSRATWVYYSERSIIQSTFTDLVEGLSSIEKAEVQWDSLLAILCGATISQSIIETETENMIAKSYSPSIVKQALTNSLKNSIFSMQRLKSLYESSLYI